MCDQFEESMRAFEFKNIVLFGLLYSFFLSLFFWPGIVYSDTWSRWIMASHFLGDLPRGWYHWALSDWFPPFPSLLMAMSKFISGGFGLLTFVVCTIIVACGWCLIIPKERGLWGSIVFALFLLHPLSANYLFLVAPDTIVLMGCVIVLVGIALKDRSCLIPDWAFHLLLIIGSALVLLSRVNGLTVIPIVLLSAFLMSSKRWIGLIRVAAGITFLILISILLPRLLDLERSCKFDYLILWEYAGMLACIDDNAKKDLYVLEENIPLEKLISTHRWYNPACYVWGESRIDKDTMREVKEMLRSGYFTVVWRHPEAFCKIRLWVVFLSLGKGFRSGNYVTFRNPGSWAEGTPVDIDYSSPLIGAGERWIKIVKFLPSLAYILNPAILLIPSGVMLILRYAQKRLDRVTLFCVLFAVSYLAGFLIFTGGFQFRYLYPVSFLLVIFLIRSMKHNDV